MDHLKKLQVFNAKWHERILPFRPKKGVFRKIAAILLFPYSLFKLAMVPIARKWVLPSSSYRKREIKTVGEIFHNKWLSESASNPLLSHFTAQPLQLITPDGAILSAVFFAHTKADENTPIILLFQPNSSLLKHMEYEWLLEECVREDAIAHFITFDYRGCGESTGKTKSLQTLTLDGDTAYQFVKEMGFSDDRIIFYGYSLGGGISAFVRALYPEAKIKYVSERSFASIGKVARFKHKKSGPFLSWIAKKSNWDINVLSVWNTLKGEKLVIYQPEDEIIPYEASLYYGLSLSGRVKSNEAIQLHLSSENQMVDFHHSAPLHHYIDRSTQSCAQKMVFDFLKLQVDKRPYKNEKAPATSSNSLPM